MCVAEHEVGNALHDEQTFHQLKPVPPLGCGVQVVDVERLTRYALRYSIPPKKRAKIWKLMLSEFSLSWIQKTTLSEITLPSPEAHRAANVIRQKELLRLWITLRRMLIFHYEQQPPRVPGIRLVAMIVLLGCTGASIFDLQSTYFEHVEHKAILLVSFVV